LAPQHNIIHDKSPHRKGASYETKAYKRSVYPINVHGSDEEDEKRERERDYSVFRIISRWSDEMEIMRERI